MQFHEFDQLKRSSDTSDTRVVIEVGSFLMQFHQMESLAAARALSISKI